MDIIYKIALVGPPEVGKTSLLLRTVENRFLEEYNLTIGSSFEKIELDHNDNHYVLQIWDMGGQERFKFLLSQYLRGTAAVILATDNLNDNFNKLDNYLQMIRNKLPNAPILLIRTKNDLDAEDGLEKSLKEYASQNGLIGPYETSAKNGYGINPELHVFNGLWELLKTTDKMLINKTQARDNDFDSNIDDELEI